VGLEPTFYLGRKVAGRRVREARGIPGVLIDFEGISRFDGAGTMAAKLEQIREAAKRVAASHGLDLVDIELVGPSKERVLRVYLEKDAEGRAKLKAAIEVAALKRAANPETDQEAETEEETQEVTEDLPVRLIDGSVNVEQLSGISHGDCSAFGRDFGVLLDVEDLVPGADYTLEVSSPGLDRKLTKAEDFTRFAGCLVKIQTFEAIRNNRHWQGRLLAASKNVAGNEARTGEAVSRSITLDLSAVKQNSKSRKTGVSTVEIALDNVEKAQLVPEF
jgi:ribosome maturation factor RimP